MSVRRTVRGFTLVELLVVIGIIALLISILLPALNKARQQANLVACSSNLRNIGQLVFEYAAENKGYLPYGTGEVFAPNSTTNTEYWAFNDTLSLMVQNNPIGPNQPHETASDLGIFQDTDAPFGHQAQSCDYRANARVLADGASQNNYLTPPLFPYEQTFTIQSLGSIKRSSQVVM